jgi:hypothetical protein
LKTERAAVVGLLLASAACGSTPVPAPAPVAPAPTPAPSSAAPVSSAAPSAADVAHDKQTRLIARMLRRVEAARGIQSTKPVPGVLLDRKDLIARVKDHVTRELPAEAIRDEGLELALFGFIPGQFDYEAAEYELLQDQLAGYYEPADGTMYMANDLGEEEASATLAHELVHALQDQRWNLADRSKYSPGQGDRSEAVSALAEGDATSAMFDVMIERAAPGQGKTAIDMPDDLFGEQIRAGMNDGPGAKAPHIMKTSLVAPYIYGTLFVHSLRRQGGWAAVNGAWDNPPTTSEQVLHIDKWIAHEAPIAIAAPAFASLGAGWRSVDEDSEGELGTRLAYEEWMDARAAAELSAGWGGDRGVLLRSGDQVAFAWRLRYDPGKTKDERAAKAWPALVKALDGALGKAQASEPGFSCHARTDRGPFAIARAGADLIVVLGPATSTAAGWSSAGDCALARKWTREIAATP